MKYLHKEEDVVKYERPEKVDIAPIKTKTNSKTFRGYLNGCLKKSINSNNKELEILFKELLDKFNKFYPQVTRTIEIVDGWKGEGTIEIYKGFDNDFRIREWIKDKHSLEVTERLIEVKKDDLNRMILIIKNLVIGEPVKCYYIATKLGYARWKDLWKERQEYFKFYYYPIKVLEALKMISYSGRGTIIRLI